MIKLELEIDEEVLNFELPQSWDEVTVKQFMDIISINRDGIKMYELVSKTINAFTGINEEHLEMMDFKDFKVISDILEFTKVDVVPVTVEYVELDDIKYYLKSDFNKLTMGEVISIETIMTKSDNNLFKVIDELLCIFLRKKKENGKLETFKVEMMDRNEMFKNLKITEVLNIFNFFLDGVTT